MKNRNIFIMATIAIIIPALLFTMTSMPKTLTVIDSLEEETTLEELIQDTPLIIKGTVLTSTTEVDKSDPTDIYTVWNVKISDILKGQYSSSHIDVKIRGGETLTHKTETESAQLVSQENVILFLAKSTGSAYGDSYHLVSNYVGKYTIDNGQLTAEIPSFNTSEKAMLEKIRTES